MTHLLRRTAIVGFLGFALVSASPQASSPERRPAGERPAPAAQTPSPAPAPAPAQTPQAPQTPPAPAQGAAQDTQPSFRTGATFVRVDAFVTKDGVPVSDLKTNDFVLKEDGVPQTIQSFEYVHIPSATQQTGDRRDPNTVAESREAAADPRRRVFVIFLDTYHVSQASAMRARPALVRFLQRIIGPDDLVAAMTPDMPPDAVSFGARTGSLEDVLNSIWGRRDALQESRDEQRLEECFPSDQQGRPTWPAVRDRRRAKMTMDALEGLVQYLGGLREERKAIITISEGWALASQNDRLMQDPRNPNRAPTGPMVGVGPGGRLGTNDPRVSGGYTLGECDAVRQEMASIDTVQQFRDLPDIANRANATFYTFDPRGLPVFDSQMGPEAPPPVSVDQAILRNKLDQLRELAQRTDGIAALNSNDLDAQLKRIADDVSSYYLLGYDSTNPKLDGKFRTINVRVTRPGLQVRFRRGYRAATMETANLPVSGSPGGGSGVGPANAGSGGSGGAGASAGASGATGGTVGQRRLASGTNTRPSTGTPEERMTAAVAGAIGALTSTRWDIPLRTRAAAAPDASGAVTGLRIVAELNDTLARSDAWQQGGTARFTIRSATAGKDLGVGEATLAPGARVLEATIPMSAPLAPGEYRMLMRLTASSKLDAVSDTAAVTVPENAHTLLAPTVLRRGPSTGTAYLPTADLRFRRQERIRLEWPTLVAPEALTVSVVNLRGEAINVPAQVSTRDEKGTRLAVVDFGFAPLAPGGYALLLRETGQPVEASVIVAVQVIP